MIKVSILLSVYNSQDKIIKTIDSIKLQSYKNFECIIVDDGSSDQTVKILNDVIDSRFKIYKCKHQGLTKALNFGLTKCKGEYICRVDADDIFLPNKIEVQKNFMDLNQNVVLVGNNIELIDNKDLLIKTFKYPTENNKILEMAINQLNSIPHSSFFIRGESIRLIKGYREIFLKAQDFDLILRLSEFGKISCIPQVLSRQRYDDKSLTFQNFNFSQMKYCVLGLASHLLKKKNKENLFETLEFKKEFDTWYDSSIYQKLFLSRICRSKFKSEIARKNYKSALKQILNSFLYDYLWPLRIIIGHQNSLTKWINTKYF